MISSRISISLTMRNPNRSASYSASLLVVLNSNLSAYVYSFPSGLTTIRPAPKPLELEAPSMNSFYVEKDDVAIAVTGDYVLQKSVTATNEETNKRTANVRILQKSQENGQNRTNTDTGTELSMQKPGECYQRSTKVNSGQPQKDKTQNSQISPSKKTDSLVSTHLYSNPNTDPDRMPLTKAKGQIPQKDKIHK
ncbi:hypothetical protein Tco_0379501 [Tanacetum coccineum]